MGKRKKGQGKKMRRSLRKRIRIEESKKKEIKLRESYTPNLPKIEGQRERRVQSQKGNGGDVRCRKKGKGKSIRISFWERGQGERRGENEEEKGTFGGAKE